MMMIVAINIQATMKTMRMIETACSFEDEEIQSIIVQ